MKLSYLPAIFATFLLASAACAENNAFEVYELSVELGGHIDSQPVKALISRIHAVGTRSTSDPFHYKSPKNGVKMRFDENEYLTHIHLYSGLLSKTEDLLIEVTGRRDYTKAPYRGELPHHLSFFDKRADVERKLGKPTSSHAAGEFTNYRSLDVSVYYKLDDNSAPRDSDTITRIILNKTIGKTFWGQLSLF